MEHLDPSRLTPGVIDPAARQAFKYGACSALAIVLHDATGWPIIAITDHHNVHDIDGEKVAGGGSALHWCVRTPSGQLLDVDGLHDPDEILEFYHGDADENDDGDPEAAIGRTTREDTLMWYREGSGSKLPLQLVATFVEPLLAHWKLR